jgi:hypothetical protein
MPYPTRDEFRFMNFDALLHGAVNLGFYAHKNYDPAFEKVMFEELCLMSRIHQAKLQGGDSPKTFPASPGVMTALYSWKADCYIIVHNRSDKPGYADVKISNGQLYQLEYGKSIPVSQGRINIPPLSTRIYSTSDILPSVGYLAAGKLEKRLPEYFRKVTNMTAALNTKAFWIWENSSSDILCASKEFDISRNPVSARLVSVADDTYMLYINGKAVQSGAYWIQYQETDLLPYLKKGQNVIAVYATNQGGAAGFLADLELTFADGSKERIISDKSWMSSGEVPAGAWIRQGIRRGTPAKELFPFGKGPWGR